MKIALIMCDEAEGERLERFGSYVDSFKIFLSATFPSAEFEVYYVFQDKFPADNDLYDLMIFSGSRASAYEKLDWISKLQAFILKRHEMKSKIVGFCFGHQVMALALGGDVDKAPQGWTLGVQDVFSYQDDPLFDGIRLPLRVIYSCKDQVMKIPPHAVPLLKSDSVLFAGYKIDHNVLSMQGHPELDDVYGKYLVNLRYEDGSIDEERRSELLKTFEVPAETEKYMQLLRNFMKLDLQK